MCVLNFVFESGVTVKNICYVVLVILFVIVLLLLHTQYAAQSRVYMLGILVLILCLCLCITSLPVNVSNSKHKHYTPADGVWQTIVTVFIIYTLIPLRIYIATLSGLLICVAHTLVAVFLAESYQWLLWRQVSQTTGNLYFFYSISQNVRCLRLLT